MNIHFIAILNKSCHIHTQIYSGYLIAQYLIINQRKKSTLAKKIWLTSFSLAIIHGLIPIIYREVKEGKTEGNFMFEKAVVYTSMITNILFTCINNLILIYGITEYSRSILLMEQASNLISISRFRKFGKRKFPTINIFCKHSYHCWSILIRLIRSYGLVYLKVSLLSTSHSDPFPILHPYFLYSIDPNPNSSSSLSLNPPTPHQSKSQLQPHPFLIKILIHNYF